jgi:hypothetical protein
MRNKEWPRLNGLGDLLPADLQPGLLREAFFFFIIFDCFLLVPPSLFQNDQSLSDFELALLVAHPYDSGLISEAGWAAVGTRAGFSGIGQTCDGQVGIRGDCPR